MAARKSRIQQREEQPQTADDAAISIPSEEPAASTAKEKDDEPFPPLRPWRHSNEAGVEVLSYSDRTNRRYEWQLKFRDGKPSDAVRSYMKEKGFHWEKHAPAGGHFNVEGAWVRENNPKTLSQDRLHAQRTYTKVREMMLREKGIASPEPEGHTPF